jgi:hypothetical protein
MVLTIFNDAFSYALEYKSKCLVNRPGGFEITNKALEFCAFQPGAEILDIGMAQK